MDKCSKEKKSDYVSPEMQERVRRIKEFMKFKGLKQQDLADAINMEPQNLSRCLKSGKVSEKTCQKIVAAFPDWRIEYLLGYDDIRTHYDWADSIQDKKDTAAQCCWGIFENSLQKKGQSLRFVHKKSQHVDSTERLHADCYYSIVDRDGAEVKRLSALDMVKLEQKLLEYSDFLTDRYL